MDNVEKATHFMLKKAPLLKIAQIFPSLSCFFIAYSLSCPSLYKWSLGCSFHHLWKKKETLRREDTDSLPNFQHRVSFHSHLHLPEALLRPVREFYVYEGAVEGNFCSIWLIYLICSHNYNIFMILNVINDLNDEIAVSYNFVISGLIT